MTCLILPHQIKAEVIGKIEAHVGNRIITSYDIESLDPVTYKKILNIPDETTRETQLSQYKEQALNFLIESTIMEIAAERDGIKVTDAEVDRAVNEIAANNKVSVEQFEKMITKEGVSLINVENGLTRMYEMSLMAHVQKSGVTVRHTNLSR